MYVVHTYVIKNEYLKKNFIELIIRRYLTRILRTYSIVI